MLALEAVLSTRCLDRQATAGDRRLPDSGHRSPAAGASMTATRQAAKPAARKAPDNAPEKWSQHVTETSDALDLAHDVFTLKDPKKIAASLKRSAEHSDRRKSDPYRSAMSMITFYINRAGANLAATQLKHLEDAKDELRALFGRPAAGHRTGPRRVRAQRS
jgi:hypothetical protein